MDTYTIVGGGGGGLPTTPHPLNTSSHNTAARRPPHPSYTQQHTTTLHNSTGYIKLPLYQLFLWPLYFMVLRGATLLRGALEGVGPENRDISGPFQGHFRVISGPFQGHFRVISGPFQGHFRAISGPFQGHFRGISGPFQGHFRAQKCLNF
jgi:hypothetical protein